MATRTEQTEEFYMQRATRLARQFQTQRGVDWEDEPFIFCRWLADQRPRWAPASWRLVRASVALMLDRSGSPDAADFLRTFDTSACARKTVRTSAQKARRLPTSDLVEILDALGKGTGEFDVLLGLWLLAGRVAGLRPSEWFGARLEGDKLIVQNAKHTNGRAHGPTRELLLHNIPEQNKGYIEEFLAELERHLEKRPPEQIYEMCRRHLRRITRRLWPGRSQYPTLYSARHQFSADLKKANYRLEEIAALFGHSTNRTASEHYGKKKSGEGSARSIEPSPQEVGQIRDTYKGRPDKASRLTEN